MKAYLGVDWSATEAETAVVAEDGVPKGMRRVEPVLEDVRRLIDWVRTELGADEVHAVIEAGSVIWKHLFTAAGAVVHVVDPKQARRFAESLCSSGAKDDRRDARVLVEMARSPAHVVEPEGPQTTEAEQLDRLSKLRDRAVQERIREVQRIRDSLRNSMPLVDQAIGSFESKWVGKLLNAAPTAWHLARLSELELRGVLRRAHDATVAKLVEAWSRTQAPWLTEATAETEGCGVRQSLQRLELLDQQIEELDAKVDGVLGSVEQVKLIRDVAGLGRAMTAALVVFGLLEAGDRDGASIRLGASPVFVGSAKTKMGQRKGVVHMRRSVSPRASQTTYLLGRLATMHHRWAAAQYEEARRRGKNAATAYRQVARSLLRLLRAVIRDGTPYDEARYEAALQARGVHREAKGGRWTTT